MRSNINQDLFPLHSVDDHCRRLKSQHLAAHPCNRKQMLTSHVHNYTTSSFLSSSCTDKDGGFEVCWSVVLLCVDGIPVNFKVWSFFYHAYFADEKVQQITNLLNANPILHKNWAWSFLLSPSNTCIYLHCYHKYPLKYLLFAALTIYCLTCSTLALIWRKQLDLVFEKETADKVNGRSRDKK